MKPVHTGGGGRPPSFGALVSARFFAFLAAASLSAVLVDGTASLPGDSAISAARLLEA